MTNAKIDRRTHADKCGIKMNPMDWVHKTTPTEEQWWCDAVGNAPNYIIRCKNGSDKFELFYDWTDGVLGKRRQEVVFESLDFAQRFCQDQEASTYWSRLYHDLCDPEQLNDAQVSCAIHELANLSEGQRAELLLRFVKLIEDK